MAPGSVKEKATMNIIIIMSAGISIFVTRPIPEFRSVLLIFQIIIHIATSDPTTGQDIIDNADRLFWLCRSVTVRKLLGLLPHALNMLRNM